MSEYIQRVYKEDFDKLRIDTKLDDAIAVAESFNVSFEQALNALNLDEELKQKVLKKLAERKEK